MGKGTYGKMVQKDFDVKAFSTGDYLREIVKRAKRQQEIDEITGEVKVGLDAFSKKISDTLGSGKLIDDEIVVEIVRNLKENPTTFLDGAYAKSAGLILDGVPRTVKQAEMLDEFLSIDLVLNFEHRDDILIQKILGRRICPECNKNFNVAHVDTEDGYFMPPLLPKGEDPTVCDNKEHADPVKLIRRADDVESVIKERIELYKRETLPILDFYRTKPNTIIVDFEAKKGKADYPHVKRFIEEALGDKLTSNSKSIPQFEKSAFQQI